MHLISFAECKTEGTKNKQEVKAAELEAWHNITRVETQCLMISVFQPSGSRSQQMIYNRVLKIIEFVSLFK